MKKIIRHKVYLDLVNEGVDGEKSVLDSVMQSSAIRPSALSSVVSTARSYAGYLSVTQPESEELCRGLRLGARAAAAIFTLSTECGEMELDLGEVLVKLPATGPTDATHVANWRIGWWLANLVGDRTSINRLVATPVDVLRRSSTRGDECQYLFVDALQAFENRADDWSTKLREALDATDPTMFNIVDEEFVLNIVVPEMQMLFRLSIGEIAPFNESLEFALVRHKKYWTKTNRMRDPDGYLALGPIAIARKALEAGLSVEVESEYMPRWLIEGGCSSVKLRNASAL